MAASIGLMARAALATVRVSVPTMMEAALGKVSSQKCDERLDRWSRWLVDDAGIHLQVNGRAHLRHHENFIVMSNHLSHYDIPVLFQALRIPMRMVAKKELFRIPFMAGAMRAAGFVKLDRGNSHKSLHLLASVRDRLQPGVSVWIAPEGTRSRNGRLGSFKRGGFYMALKTGMRILPVTIEGTQRVLPSRSLSVSRGGEVTVTVGAPIDPAAYGYQRINDLVMAVRNEIELPMQTTSIFLGASSKAVVGGEWAR